MGRGCKLHTYLNPDFQRCEAIALATALPPSRGTLDLPEDVTKERSSDHLRTQNQTHSLLGFSQLLLWWLEILVTCKFELKCHKNKLYPHTEKHSITKRLHHRPMYTWLMSSPPALPRCSQNHRYMPAPKELVQPFLARPIRRGRSIACRLVLPWQPISTQPAERRRFNFQTLFVVRPISCDVICGEQLNRTTWQ